MDGSATEPSPEWLPSPSGKLIYLPEIRRDMASGCGGCGEAVFLVTDMGICCPNPQCVRPRKDRIVYGKFDVRRCVVVEVDRQTPLEAPRRPAEPSSAPEEGKRP